MTQMLYAIQSPGGGPVKIGITANLPKRFATLRASSPVPLEIKFSRPSSSAEELAIHKALSSWRLHFEWFQDVPEVWECIRRPMAGLDKSEAPERTADGGVTRQWTVNRAASALRVIAWPVGVDEPTAAIIDRVAQAIGCSSSRALELWYGRARRIDAHEFGKIIVMAADVCAGPDRPAKAPRLEDDVRFAVEHFRSDPRLDAHAGSVLARREQGRR